MRRGFLKGQQESQVQARALVFKLGLKNYTLVTGIWLGQILLTAPDPKPARVNGKCSANFSERWIGALNVQPGGKTRKDCAAAHCMAEERRARTVLPFAVKTSGCTAEGGNRVQGRRKPR